jgi:hypothetical protein
MPSEKERAAKVVEERWLDFQTALSDKRKYPLREFHAFGDAVRRYVDLTKKDALLHRAVVCAVNGLTEFIRLERKRVPEDVLWHADRLECILFSGYDPHFEGDEPPGL